MSKFDKAKSANVFGAVAKVEQEKAQLPPIIKVRNTNLIDNPRNGEDVSETEDLEVSMKQLGFTDPIEVTDFGMENGKYMIISGHRRRAAAVKVFGDDFVFPCMLVHCKDEHEVQNYTLLANCQRDSAKDPFLFCKRYKMHKEYFDGIDYKGSKREVIAQRLGISAPQLDRHIAMTKVILPVWNMVRAEEVGYSSVVPLAKYTPEEQMEVYEIMQDALKKDVELTRPTVKKIVDGYDAGKKTWAEIANLPRDSGIPLNAFMNTDNGQTRDSDNHDRNDEVRRGYDPIAAEYDAMDAEAAERAKQREEDEKHQSSKEEKPELSESEKRVKLGEEIAKQVSRLDNNLHSIWACSNAETAREMLHNMSSLTEVLVNEMYTIATSWDMPNELQDALDNVIGSVDQFYK